MAEKKKCMAVIVSQSKISEGIYSMWLQFPGDYNIAAQAVPGQFISMTRLNGKCYSLSHSPVLFNALRRFRGGSGRCGHRPLHSR